MDQFWPPGDSEMARLIRKHDWAATPLGPVTRWPQSLKTIVELMLGSPSMMSLVWGPNAIHLYNDRFAELLHEHRTLSLGQSAFETFARSRDVFANDLAAGMAGKSARLLAQRYPVLREDRLQDAWFDVEYAPVSVESGEVGGVLWSLREVTSQVKAERALSESEARHRLLTSSWAQAMWETDADGVVVSDSPSWRAYTGQTLEEWLRYGWLNAIHPDDRAYAEQQWREAIAARTLVNAEFRLRSPDGGWRWTNVRAAPVLDEGGRIEKFVGMNIDIDAYKRAGIALRQSEDRQAFLLALSDALRPLADVGDIISVATRLLAERLGVSRCYYAEWPAGADYGLIARDYAGPGVASLAGRYPIEAFQSAYDRVAQGRTWVVEDNAVAEGISDAERRHHQAIGVIAWVDVPLVKEGRPVAVLCLVDGKPRRWTAEEIESVEETAERMWAAVERARAEAELRRSEGRLRALFESIDEGFSEMQVILDEEDHVVDWLHLALNGNFSRVTGIPDITGRLASEVFPNLEGEWFRRMDLAYRTGEPQRFETELAELGRWFDNYITRLGDEDDVRMLGVFGDITERKLAERKLRESEERQAFLLRLSDALRPLADPGDIQRAAIRILGEQLKASRVFYVLVEKDGDTAVIHANYTDGVPDRVGRYSLSALSSYAAGEWRAGRTASTSDVNTDPRWSESEREAYASVSTRAGFGVPLIKEGRLVALLGVNQSTPRHWTDREIDMASEVAERTWAAVERAQAETALMESEERLRQFGEASQDVLWIRDAETFQWDYLTPAFETIYGLDRQTALSGDTMAGWLDLIVPEDRDHATSELARVRDGEWVTFEYRIRRPSDGEVRWLRNTGFPIHNDNGQVTRIGGISHDITEEKELAERMGVLVAELQHRTRNLMGVVRSTADRTLRRSKSLEDFTPAFKDRLLALSRVQGLLSRMNTWERITFDELIGTEMAALDAEVERLVLDEPSNILLRSSTVQTLAMALHELATNALKYGALKQETGQLSISWRHEPSGEGGVPWLHVDWRESGVDMPPEGSPAQGGGLGRELIERALPHQLGAKTTYVMEPDGVHCTISLPVSERTKPETADA